MTLQALLDATNPENIHPETPTGLAVGAEVLFPFEASPRFRAFAIRDGILLDLRNDPSPAVVRGWRGGELALPDGETHFGIAATGAVELILPRGRRFPLTRGMFFAAPGACRLAGDTGQVLVISRPGYRGLFQIGGPLEPEGRLRYIDGCSDTLLVAPPRLGDPCLNHLHVPAGTHQTAHTHPSTRLGVILAGGGECRTAEGAYPLRPGIGWYIPAGCLHSFHTEAECLDVVAWHPDSDYGPTDEAHPMLNRTVIGQAARSSPSTT